MKKHLMLVKIGGGFITNKATPMTPNIKAIQHIGQEIAAVCKRYPETDMIIGNGVGSYAHFTAHEYGLREGAIGARGMYGAAKTHLNAQKINMLFADELLAQDIPAFTVSPASILVNKQKEVTFFTDTLHQALQNGVVPVLHGDTILDSGQGVKIFSTENVLQKCLTAFRKQYEKITVVYAANSNGVMTKNGEALSILHKDDAVEVQSTYDHDVTGGIVGKVQAARAAARIADEAFIVDGWQKGIFIRIIQGDQHVATKVL